MASISSLSSASSSSSVYGNRTYNVISGLASGLDTEELISGMVQSYQQKIQSLQSDRTSLEWQQQAYQSISDKLVEFARNYTSYAYSSTNLLSSSFFQNAVNTSTNGIYAGMVSASGSSSSQIIINSIQRLASAARYASAAASNLDSSVSIDKQSGAITVTGEAMGDLDGSMTLSKLSGSLSLSYGSTTLRLSFDESELFETDGKFDAKAFRNAITEKLKEQKITTSSGSTVTADSLIDVEINANPDGSVASVVFSDKSGAGNLVAITGASGDLKDKIADLDDAVENKSASFHLDTTQPLTEQVETLEYISGKNITITLDGKSKTFQLPTKEELAAIDPDQSMSTAERFQAFLQTELDNAFGSKRVTVGSTTDGALTFQVAKGSTFSMACSNTAAGNVLGIGSQLTSYLDTGKTLGELNLEGWDWSASTGKKVKGTGSITEVTDADGNKSYVDANGKAVDAEGYLLDEDGKSYLYAFELTINGTKIGEYTKNTELNTVLNDINSNTEAGVNVTYSKTSGQFIFTAKDTGSSGKVDIRAGGLADKLFGATMGDNGELLEQAKANYTEGDDAQLNVTINGETMDLSRASNTFDLDGMSVTLNGTFAAANDTEKVTFTSTTDADKIVDAVKKMVEDFNAIIKEVKSAYSDMPLEQSDGSRYEPLTDEDMADMSESAIEAYEEKAKTGILFMDSDLSSLYNELRNAISSSGADGATLRAMGISTSYSEGLTTLTFDEQAFREALASDPDQVQEAFTKSKSNGAATDGLMTTIKNITDRYASTTGEPKGILIEKAGSQYSPSAALDNTLLNQMQEIEEEIAKWQDKMSNQVDYYTNKFTQLELLINQMNSQSSALSGLLSG